MSALIRDAAIGQIIRFVTRNRVLKYPEELEGWQCPSCYDQDGVHQGESSGPLPKDVKEALAVPTEPAIQEGKVFEEPKEEVESPPEEPVEEIERNNTKSSSDEDLPEKGLGLTEIPTAASAAYPHLATIKSARTTTGLEKVGTRAALRASHTRADLEE